MLLRRWLLAALTTSLVTSACFRAPPPPLRRTRLVMEERGGGLRAYVRAQVAGEPLDLLVDTGAFQGMLPAEFARARRLPLRPAPADVFLVDANGRRAPLVYLDRVPVQFEGEAPGTLDFILGWGQKGLAILVPQELARRGRVVIVDFLRGELSCEEEGPALERLRREAPLQEVTFATCGLFDDAHRVVSATVGGVPVTLAVDTGAERTMLARNNPALRTMLQAEGTQGSVAGVVSTGHGLEVPDVKVEFGGLSRRIPVIVSPASQECGTGLLGADLLRHCVLVWGASDLWISCRPPAEEAPAASGR